MSDSTFVNLHEQMQNKGWISDWEFNEVIDLYKYNGCATIAACQGINSNYKSDVINGAWLYHLGKLNIGSNMFYQSTIASFSGDLSSLTNSYRMFYDTTLASFSSDLSSLTNGWDMFRYSALASFSGDLPKLTEGYGMFYKTPLTSFNGDLSSLSSAHAMFNSTALTSFNGDLSSLTHGSAMFYHTPLESFNGDLSNLTTSGHMFRNTALTSFKGDLPRMTSAHAMFYGSALESFNGDLSSLTNGTWMFCYTHTRTYTISHYKMVGGVKQEVKTSITATGLKTFNSNLSSLKSGYYMFGSSASNASPLSEKSIMIIADTINDISTLNKSVESDWEYTYYGNSSSQTTTSVIESDYRGILHLGYDKSITDKTNIFKYCDEIVAKGWTVYLNGSQYTSTDSGSVALIDDESTSTPIPHYYKPVQVTDENVAEYIDGNNNYYIIVGGQHVFGDDISTYGMFTSYEHAVSEISISLELIPYEKPDEEIIEE